jgi:hypothetical protein
MQLDATAARSTLSEGAQAQVAALGAGPLSVGPLGEPFAGIERIAVLRGGGLGDLLF